MGPVDRLAQTVRVQAGAVTEAVHKHCEPHGLTWPVDFASKGSSHVGGNISTNAGGVKVIHYGMTRNWVLGLQVVTINGDVLELNGALEKNNTGVDLRQLFIGSEGTLGIVTEATLKLARVPEKLDVFFFAVDDMPAVLKLFLEARRAPFTLMAFECLTHGCLEAVMWNLTLKSPFSDPSGAYVLMEVERPASPDAQAVLDGWLAGLFDKELVRDGTIAQSPREARELWMLREGISESLTRKAFLHKNDIALPIAELEPFVAAMNELFKGKYPGIGVYLFGHIGDGNLHVNALKPDEMSREEFLKHAKDADRELFALVQKHHGSVSAEHGIGLLKKEALRFSRTPAELEIFRQLKKVFDPQGLLNPGKIL
jgi:FAD/FMN-containing dehydrogenase